MYDMNDTFLRIKSAGFSEAGQTVYLNFLPKVYDKLEDDPDFQNLFDFQSYPTVIQRIADPKSDHHFTLTITFPEGERLRLRARPDSRRRDTLFVFAGNWPNTPVTGPSESFQLQFSQAPHSGNSDRNIERFLFALDDLPLHREIHRKDIDAEFKIWEKFLHAQKLIMEEKSIPLFVTQGTTKAKGQNSLLLTWQLSPRTFRFAEFKILESYLEENGGKLHMDEQYPYLEFWGQNSDLDEDEIRELLDDCFLRLRDRKQPKQRYLPFTIKNIAPKTLFSIRQNMGQRLEEDRIEQEEKNKKRNHFHACLKIRGSKMLLDDQNYLRELTKGSEQELRFIHAEGTVRWPLQINQNHFNEHTNQLYYKIKGYDLFFLNPKEFTEYEEELAGKTSDYRGGLKLGRLKSMRNGKIEILVEDKDDLTSEPEDRTTPGQQPADFSKGYLLPKSFGDRAQIQRMQQAMKKVKYKETANPNLPNFIFDTSYARLPDREMDPAEAAEFKSRLIEKRLNPQQESAVRKALLNEDLCLIQGPPGTGKTTVIAEIINQMIRRNPEARILLTSQSHLAVDNALDRLYAQDHIRPIRIASSAHSQKAVEEEGQKYFRERIDKWAEASPGSDKEKADERNVVREWMERIRTTSSDTPPPNIAPILKEWRELLDRPEIAHKKFFANIYLNRTNVVAATCMECGRRDFKERWPEFDCVIVDEASKATPVELLIPLVSARKVVIIGDHKQLPPMIDDKEIREVLKAKGHEELAEEIESMKTAQFEKLFLQADSGIRETLRTQYRMHKQIMELIDPFYKEEGGLICGIEGTMNLPDFSDPGSRHHGLQLGSVLTPDKHVLWIDTKHPETDHQPSYSNNGEIEAIRKLLHAILKSAEFNDFRKRAPGEQAHEIGLVSFYGQQVKKLRKLADEYEDTVPFRVRTVDKFQGMERDIMIVSTVRSHLSQTVNQKKEPRRNSGIGFARDYRRLNVALSRARRLLIVVGNLGHFVQQNSEHYGHLQNTLARQNAIASFSNS